MIEDDDLLEKYKTIWNKVSANIKEEFDSELVYNKNYLKTKIKSQSTNYWKNLMVSSTLMFVLRIKLLSEILITPILLITRNGLLQEMLNKVGPFTNPWDTPKCICF